MTMNPMPCSRWTAPLALLGCLALAAAGCVEYDNPNDKQQYQAPLLTGSNDAQDKLDLRGNLDFGSRQRDVFSQDKPLTGYVFDALPGARVTIGLTVDNGEDPVLILYGPQDEAGIWGRHIALDDDGKDGLNSLISDFRLPAGGRYLIALATYDGSAGGDFDLLVGCAGNCDEPRCPDVMCTLYCPNGFMTDPDGCPLCRCAGVECEQDADCAALPWADLPPRCVAGQCIYDELSCDADTPCPEGFHCVQDACPGMPCDPDDGDCPPCPGHCEPSPQCGAGELCQLPDGRQGRCLDGRCVPPPQQCQADADCPEGMFCEVVCWDCAPEDPDCAPGCEGVCVPAQPPECAADADCPAGHECIMDCWGWCDETGECHEECHGRCVPVEPECLTDEDCFFPGGMARCIEGRCVFEEIACDDQNPCPEGMICEMVCWDCPPDDPDCEPGCEGVCVPEPQPECFDDADCISAAGEPGRCVDGRCVFEPIQCQFDAQCPPEHHCRLEWCLAWCTPDDPECCYGVCVPDYPPECQTDEDCIAPDGQSGRCLDGRCVFDDCVCPEVWDPVCAEVCETPDCPPDEPDCGGGCELRTFDNPCFADCAGAFIVHDGPCGEPPPECLSDADCGPGAYCEPRCEQPCDPNDPGCTCPGVCVPLPPMECLADADCPEGFRCEPGQCPDMPCEPGAPDCPPCPGQCVPAASGCIVTGCSGEICAPYPVSSSCVWLPEYECLIYSSCEALTTADGQQTCGWTQPPAYLECLEQLQGGDSCDSDADCGPGAYCHLECWPDGYCEGRCMTADCVCPEVLDPVCGVDGVTYDNPCYAMCAGVAVHHAGGCGDEDQP
jgi:Cys-rich repeat protein